MTKGEETSEKKTGSAVVDVMSPFFISGSDNPNIVFTSDLLRDGNYTDWADEISNALFAKNKFGFVDGSIPIPEEGSPELLLWKRCNAMVRGWLHSSMDKEIRNSVKHAKTAREVWEDLQERFGSESAPRAYELKHILSLTRQEKMSVSAYYTKLKGLWDEIQAISPLPKCKCGGCTCDINKQLIAMKEKERLYEFLMGLDESFGTVKTQILSTKPMVPLGASFHLVSEDERQKQIYATGKTSVEAAAFQTQAARLNDKNWGAPKENRREPKKCTHCGKLYHSVEECYEIVGYPKQGEKGGRNGGKKEDSRYKLRGANKSAHMAAGSSPLPGITTEQYSKLVEYFSKSGDTSQVAREENPISANMAGKINNLNSWIIDSGATEHITCDSMLLENQTSCGTEIPVKIPNGETVPVKSIGNANLPNGLKLNQVLNIPDFKCNLLSVSKLTRNLNCALTFFPDFCVMQDLPSRNLIGMGRHCDGLYLLEPTIKKGTALSVKVDSKTWHKRLGHASSLKIQQLDGSFGSFGKNNEHCDSCLRAKLTRLPFPISSIQTASCFELIHCDIWGGYRTPSLSGAHYFLTIVDDFSRGVWVFLMKHKSDVSHFLISFCNMVHKQFGKCVKRIRSDNGVEFQSKSMIDYYGDNGIILETSCTDTPQQNGIVERKHRHILEIARALRFEAELPIEFWGECVLTATYIINRLPSKVLKHKTPYEVLFGKAPSCHHLRIFGCLVYAKDNKKRGDKFGERGRRCIFVGYPYSQKGYRVFDLETRKIFTSRDVKFVENILPFKKYGAEGVIVGDINKKRQIEWEEDEELLTGVGRSTMDDSNGSNSVDSTPMEDIRNQPTQVVASDSQRDSEGTRKSERTKYQPKRLENYVTDLPKSIDHSQPIANSETSEVYPLAHFVSYDRFSNNHKAYLAAITSHDEPKFFYQAVKDSRWCEAMKKEIKALEENGTWILVSLPPGKKAIDSKWVYKIKYKPNGEIERYKARLVAKGFKQIEGIDFHETFAPVAKLVTVRSLLAIASKKNWVIHQLDVNNAFLHGDLVEDVYMKIPQGFAREGDTRVCKLQKSLYGLRQASRNWYHKFTRALVDIGFRQSRADHSLFIFKRNGVYVAALIYVDDVILVGNDARKIDDVKEYLDKLFSIKDLGPLKYFLGIEVARSAEGIVLSQRKYTLDILEDSGLQGSRPSEFPMEQNLRLSNEDNSPQVDTLCYRRLIGRLLYLTVTRPDIQFAVNYLSQFITAPRQSHMDAAVRILRFLKATAGQGLFLPANKDFQLEAYCDADWGGCSMTRRSCTGYFISLGGSPISWRTKKQSVVSRSSAEAEYRAMATTISEILWLRWLLKDIEATQTRATPLHCDNQAACHIANNPVFHERTKHVEMDCYFVRERVESKDIEPRKISTDHQVEDLFTKALGASRFRYLAGKLGIRDLHAPT